MEIFVPLTNIILTILIIIFARLQWISVKEQNNLSLLKLRIEHYRMSKKQIHSIWSNIDILTNNTDKSLKKIYKTHIILKDFSDNVDESLFLFGERIYRLESNFIKTTRRYLNIIEKRPQTKLNIEYFKNFTNTYTDLCIDIISFSKKIK